MHWQLLTVILVMAAPAPAEDKKKDEEKIQGAWTIVSLEENGNKVPEDKVKAMKVTIKDNVLALSDGSKEEKVKFKIDASKKPKSIDFFMEGEEGQMQGIYELEGDTLKMCWHKEGKESKRPNEFSSKSGSGHSLVVLKREKKDK
jgi:uncharacterized protein (TIGR03067 family)